MKRDAKVVRTEQCTDSLSGHSYTPTWFETFRIERVGDQRVVVAQVCRDDQYVGFASREAAVRQIAKIEKWDAAKLSEHLRLNAENGPAIENADGYEVSQ